MAAEEDRSTRDEVATVVRAVLSRARDATGTGADALGSGVEDAVRALVGHRVRRAIDDPAPSASPADVVLALSDDGPSSVARDLGTTGAWIASRGRAARFLGRRTPLGLALLVGPGLYDSIRSSLHGLDAAAAHLVARTRRDGHDPDPDRVRAVVVQALTGQPVDPDGEVDHGALVRMWLADAGRRVAPFGLRTLSGLTRRRTPDAVAAALAGIDPRRLRG